MKEKTITITILGSGTSTGVPVIGCDCTVCNSNDPKDKRMRASILITTKLGKKVLIDTTPDFRTQALGHKIKHLDSVIITHVHADHLHGIDDLRPLCFSGTSNWMDVYAEKDCANTIKNRFGYIFPKEPKKSTGGWIPQINLLELDTKKEQIISQIPFIFLNLPHGNIQTTGFIQNKFAYITDCSSIPPQSLDKLKNAKLDLLIIECIREKRHKTHLNLEMAFKYIKEISPKRAGLIHMGHHYFHQDLKVLCDKEFKSIDVFPLYDGQQLNY